MESVTVITNPALCDIPDRYTGLVYYPGRMGRCQTWFQGQIISIRPSQLEARSDLSVELSRGRVNYRYNPLL